MATRSTVTIWYQPKPGNPAYKRHHLYRHWDGGMWGNGHSLAHVLHGFSFDPSPDSNGKTYWLSTQTAADELAERILDVKTDSGRPCYEKTTHADDHGDTEYHYDIFLDYGGGITWRYRNRPVGRDKWEWIEGGNVQKLRKLVAKELMQIRRRIHRRKALKTA